MSEMCSGVRTLVARMESNPEEFFGDATKWRFMFNANFREVLTEPEKGALHEALKGVRRKEFDTLVVKEILKEEMEDTLVMKAQGRYALSGSAGLSGPMLGGSMTLASNTAGTTRANTIQLGQETLSDEDIRSLKDATKSTGWFK